MKRVLMVFSLMVGLGASAFAGGVDVGDSAPDFTLVDQSGNEVTFSEIEGVRVLEWTNPDCPFVKRHYKAGTMKDLAAEYGDQGVTWLTINSTHYMDRAANASFSSSNKLEQMVLTDASGAVGHAYGAATTPHMFIVNDDDVVVYEGAIDDDPRGSKDGDATNYVAAALDEVLAGDSVSTSETKPYGCSVKYKK